jgi:transcriptional regulator with XRE-family HTH domain
MASIPELPLIGKNVHNLRKKISLSLDELAGRCGVSKAMLSQIEQGKVNPTIATLWKIARGLGVDFNAILGNQDNDRVFYLQKNDTATVIQNPEKTVEMKILTPPQTVDELELYWLSFKPKGALISDPHFTYTEEIVTVLSGSVEVKAGDKTAVLNKGDSIRYHADIEHSITETANKNSEIYLTVHFKENK